MERRKKRNVDNDRTHISWIVWLFVIVGIVTFFISYMMYGSSVEDEAGMQGFSDETASYGNNMLNTMSNEVLSKVNLDMGKAVNEVENSVDENNSNSDENNNEAKNETEKIAVNTSKIENEVISERQAIIENKMNETIETEEDPTFIKPVDGEIVKDYSKDNLIYSNTLQEWTTHLGIDYEAEKTSIVKASADGKIKSIKNDPRYGLTIVIEHSNGFTSMYSNLLSTEFVSVGEEVKAGQTIATVGNTAVFEIADSTHLHFEIMKDGENVDPNLYIK